MVRPLAAILIVWLFLSAGQRAHARQAGLDAGDARLSRPARVEAEGVAVGELLERVAREAGVLLAADRDTADDKVVVFGPARPLRETLADLAALLGAEWRRGAAAAKPGGEGGGAGYTLRKRPDARRCEDALASSVRDQWLRQLEAQVRALGETPARLARRHEDDLTRYWLSHPDGKARRATGFFATLTPRQRRDLLERGHLRLFFGSLPAPQQAALVALMPKDDKGSVLEAKPLVVTRRRTAPPDLEFSVALHAGHVAVLFFHPGYDAFARVRAVPPRLPRRGNPYTGDPVPDDAPLPTAAQTEAAADGRKKADWVRRLRRLSEATGQPVLSDYYRLRCDSSEDDKTPRPEDARPSAAGALDAFCERENALWWVRGRTLLFRRRDWYERRLYEPPDRWLDSVARGIRGRGDWAAYEDALRLRDLTPWQLAGLAALAEERRGPLPYGLSRPFEKLAGLPELLALLRVRPHPEGRPQKPLLRHEPASREAALEWERAYEAATLHHTHLTPYQRALIAPFLAAQRQGFYGNPPDGFFCCLLAYPPQAADRDYRFQRVRFRWQNGVGGAQGNFEVPLPLTLPDDRRRRTRVEVSP